MATYSPPPVQADGTTIIDTAGVLSVGPAASRVDPVATVNAAAAINAATVYTCPGDAQAPSATEADHQMILRGTRPLSGLAVRLSQAVQGAATLTVRARLNGANVGTAIALVAADGITWRAAASFGSVVVADGDILTVSLTGDMAGTTLANTRISLVVTRSS